jgi:hypothetical protein
MIRRFIAVFGMLALATTILPAMPETAFAALECCNGVMCPMHPPQIPHSDCGMDTSGASLKPCPGQTAHYMATMSFVLLAPTILHDDAQSEPAHAFLSKFSPEAQRRVDSPPPRLLLTA